MSTKLTESIMSEIKREYIESALSRGERIDGRGMDEFREIKIEKGIIPRAEGSAMVTLGNTKVLAGIKVEPGEPFPDTPERGVMTTNAELVPVASPTFEPGPPGEDAVELARVVDRGIRESGTIDLGALVVEPGEKVWIVFIDLYILDYDGNLFDASSLAAVAALTDTVVPAERWGLGEDFKLPVTRLPVSTTFVKIGKNILLDPSRDEEAIAQARITVTTTEGGMINAVQKGLSGTFTMDEVRKVINKSIVIGEQVRERYLR